MAYKIRKSSGYREEFDEKKFKRSLAQAGASPTLIKTILNTIKERRPTSTNQIHEIAVELLHKAHPPVAARYNLKRALMDLGPAGFPFEQFVAELFRAQGYEVKTNVTVAGYCVDHEVDIVATKDNEHFMIECKFHNKPGLKSDVKVALYIHARFQDIEQAWEMDHAGAHKFHQAWVITNTFLTSDAVKFGECRNVRMISWSYPLGENLARMIDRLGLHPITALTSISNAQKKMLIKAGIVLCRDTQSHQKTIESLGFSQKLIQRLLSESEGVCKG